MFDVDPIGAMFLIIAVLWLIAAVAYGRNDRRYCAGHASPFGTDLRIPKVRETSSTAMTDRSILRCATPTKTSSAVVERRQASHANSYHHGRCPAWFTHEVADGDIERNDGAPMRSTTPAPEQNSS